MPTCTFVYAVDYGSDARGEGLSLMGIKTLSDALLFLAQILGQKTWFGFCGADLSHLGMEADKAIQWKLDIVQDRLPDHAVCLPIKARNSIDEAVNMKIALGVAQIGYSRIPVGNH